MTNQNRIIGILGGMGPEAGCLMHRYVNSEAKNILHTIKDADHPSIIHYSMPEYITDRSAFLLGHTDKNPADELIKQAQLLNDTGRKLNKKIIASVSCDTFHAPRIWQTFIKAVENLEYVSMINMVNETISFIQETYPKQTLFSIFGTLGSRKEMLYESRLLPLGYQVIDLDPEQLNAIHQVIYNPSYGVKANSIATETACNMMASVVKLLKEQGVQKIILGCTELSLFFPDGKNNLFIDPMLLTAKKLVQLSTG